MASRKRHRTYEKLAVKYAGLKEGAKLKPIQSGYDWILVNFQGKPLYVSKSFLVTEDE